MSICAGSVPNRELFEEWAAKKVDLPRLSECFELRRSESLGIHAVARLGSSKWEFILTKQVWLQFFLNKSDLKTICGETWWNIFWGVFVMYLYLFFH